MTGPAIHLTVHEDDVWSTTSAGDRRLTWRELAEDQAKRISHLQALVQVLGDLDRCEHGRHEGDVCSGVVGCNGPSKGNPLLPDGYGKPIRPAPGTPELRQVGFGMDRRPIVVPPRSHTNDPAAWRVSIPAGLRDEVRAATR